MEIERKKLTVLPKIYPRLKPAISSAFRSVALTISKQDSSV